MIQSLLHCSCCSLVGFYLSFRPARFLISSLTIGPLFVHTLSGPQAFFRNFSSGHQLSLTVMPRLPSSV
ncbi:MAG: CRISPR-associated protein Cas5 [Prevotella sp.]|nr:CRISPR-associated protein Cas5 [Prevotella sp.]